jgi:hypothetical protein
MSHTGGLISPCIIDRDYLIHIIIPNIPDQAPLAVFPPCMLSRDNKYARRSFPTDVGFGHHKQEKKNRICDAEKTYGKPARWSTLLVGPQAPSRQPSFDRAGKSMGRD